MKKEKVNDKELVKTFKNCTYGDVSSCRDCKYKLGRGRCNMKKLYEDVVALIDRLQGENERLKKLKEKLYSSSLDEYVLLLGSMQIVERLEDLLIEFDEMSFFPGTTVPDPDAYARDYRKLLTEAIDALAKEYKDQVALNKLMLVDMDDLMAQLERRVEDVYPEFMQDYKAMRDELNACYAENGKLKAENERIIKEKDEAVKDKVKEILQKVKSFALDKEVGLKYLIDRLAKENGVEVK